MPYTVVKRERPAREESTMNECPACEEPESVEGVNVFDRGEWVRLWECVSCGVTFDED